MLSEHGILLSVLIAVFASLPLAVLIRSYFPQPDRRVAEERAAMRMAAEAVPAQVCVPPPLPPAWINPASQDVSSDPWSPPQANLESPLPAAFPHDRAWSRKDAWFAVILAIVVALLLGPVTTPAATPGESAGEGLHLTTEFFLVSIFFQAGIIGLVLGYLCAHRRFNAVSLFGLRNLSPVRTVLMAVLYIIPALFVLNIIANSMVPLIQHLTGIDVKPQILVEKAPEISGSAQRALLFITLCVGAPLMEELIFRGVLFSVAAKFIHPVYANAASSLFFGVIHNNLLTLVPLTLLGAIFAKIYQRTGSLAVPVLMHSLFNGVQFFLLLYGPKGLT